MPQLQETRTKREQIADYLRERILNGTYPPGQPVPSEERLAKEFGCTRPTVRDAIAVLHAQGFIYTIEKRGNFVRAPHLRPPVTAQRGVRREPDGRYAELDGLRLTTSGEPKPVRRDATVEVADLLHIQPGEPLVTYDQLQTADGGRVHQAHRTSIPFSILAGSPLEKTPPPPGPALYAAFESAGWQLHWTEYVRSHMPLPADAEALRLTGGQPVLHILRVTHDQDDRPLALEETRLPGDQAEAMYRISLTGTTRRKR